MKKFNLLIPILAVLSINAFAQEDVEVEVEVEDVTMDVMEHKRGHRHLHGEIRSIVADYMIEQGDITAEELEARRTERQAVREELHTLREAGDEEALSARLSELREERSERREQFQSYLADHEDLAEAIEEQREQMRERRQERRNEWRDTREEQDETNEQ